jgi:hypothetical protein
MLVSDIPVLCLKNHLYQRLNGVVVYCKAKVGKLSEV